MAGRVKFAIGAIVVSTLLILVADYAWVRSKERRLSSAVSIYGGKIGSIPVWPFGTEYRITFDRPLSPHELEQLDIANQMRGTVMVAFRNWDLSETERGDANKALWACHLFVVQENQTTVRISDRYSGSTP